MARSDWDIVETDEGFVLEWKGRRWPAAPRRTEKDAASYLLRICARYAGDSPGVIIDSEEEDAGDRQRGGPWRYSYPDGDDTVTDVIHTSAKSDAKGILRRKLGRKRLPNGIEWEIAEEFGPV